MASEPRFPEVAVPHAAQPRQDALGPPGDEELEPVPVFSWRPNAVLFLLTLVSVFYMGAVTSLAGKSADPLREALSSPWSGWPFAVPLLAILLAHEFGHFIAARLHGVPASLPYFLPLPLLSPFGTMGAVIAMPQRIKSRNALLDIGAAGPLAGMVVAIPVLAYGLSLSPVLPASGEHYVQEGQGILYWLLKRWVLGPMPPGHDVLLHPTAFAGWAGFLVTMINLLPWGQLDGGHIAYALFGPVQNRAARIVHLSLIGLFVFNLQRFVLPVLQGKSSLSLGGAVMNSLFWLIWFLFLGGIARVARGADHPPTEPGTLTPLRRVVAVISLLLFAVLFMPTPMAEY